MDIPSSCLMNTVETTFLVQRSWKLVKIIFSMKCRTRLNLIMWGQKLMSCKKKKKKKKKNFIKFHFHSREHILEIYTFTHLWNLVCMFITTISYRSSETGWSESKMMSRVKSYKYLEATFFLSNLHANWSKWNLETVWIWITLGQNDHRIK